MNLKELIKYEKRISKLLLSCVSKDETRRSMLNCVNHFSRLKMLVSTDGHRAFLSGSLYDPELADKSLNINTFTSIKHEFPNVTAIFCESKVLKGKCINVSISEGNSGDSGEKPSLTYFYENGNANFENDGHDGKPLFALNSKYLTPLKGFYYDVFYTSSTGAVVFKLHDETKDYMVIMPVKI